LELLAISLFERNEQHFGNNQVLLWGVGFAYLQQKNWLKSQRCYQRGIEVATEKNLDPMVVVSPMDNLAAAYLESGDYEKAKATLSDAMSIARDFHRPQIFNNLNSHYQMVVNAQNALKPPKKPGKPNRRPKGPGHISNY
jgi:tetratricopeptide (TPR) repeat protein